MTLNMVQMHPDPAALVRFLATQGLNRDADSDLGYGVHAWLAATFGDLAPKPFRFHLDPDNCKPPKLLAYSPHGRERLLDQALTFAEPAARAVCPLEQDLAVAELPGPERWSPGRRVGFEVLACPVARRSRDGVERDAFLDRADRAPPDAGLNRALVYRDWLAARLDGVAELESAALAGFHLVTQWRQGQRAGRWPRGAARLTRPVALLRGVLRVSNGAAFHTLLGHGIGRHRAFGYGMLLLRPV
jgi:CRISPR system Cascade subunit CasE